jgi:hypothetical protein
MEWILRLSLICAFISWAGILSGCNSTRSVIHESEYQKFKGARYALREPLYIVEFTDGSGRGSLKPHTTIGGVDEVSQEHIGETHYSTVLLGWLPQGTLIEVIDVVRHKHIEMGTSMEFYVRPVGPLGEQWPKLQTGFIEIGLENGQPPDPPKIDPEFAVPVGNH